MPVELQLKEEGGLALFVASDTVTGEEHLHAHERLLANRSAMAQVRRILSDWSRVQRVEMDTGTIRKVAQMCGDAAREAEFRGRVAVVAVDDLTYGLARMWEAFVDGAGWEHRVFRDRAEATAWLAQKSPVE